jgi:hypothetical protein
MKNDGWVPNWIFTRVAALRKIEEEKTVKRTLKRPHVISRSVQKLRVNSCKDEDLEE